MITLYINNKEVKLTEPTTVLKAARGAGFTIPTLCDDELLNPEGHCRLCLVEVENMPRLQTACTLKASDGMVIRTDTDEIKKARKGMLEFLLINHPLDCPDCDKAGECALQELVNLYGAAKGRYKETKRKITESFEDPIIARNMKRCIMCRRCIRMCNDVQGASALSVMGQGGNSRVEAFSEGKYNCEYCGNCITVCPVGSILSRVHLHGNRPWQVSRQVDTICGYCPVGCAVTVRIRDEKVRRVLPRIGHGVSKGLLCVRGRFGYDFVNHRDRLKTPLIKKKGEFHYCTWEEAYEFVTRRLQEIIDEHGSHACGALSSGNLTNEAHYVLQKFMRSVVGTNNIDSSARLTSAGALRLLETLLYSGVTSTSLTHLGRVDTIFVLGGDPTVINPILGINIRRAFKKGVKVITMAPSGGLRKFSSLEVITPLYGENSFLGKLIFHLYKKKGFKHHGRAIEKWIQVKYSASEEPGDAAIPHEFFIKALDILLKSRAMAIVLGPDLIQRTDGYRHLISISALAVLLKAHIYFMSLRPNDQGLIDMGCVPDGLPGRGLVSTKNLRKKFEQSWNVKISDKPGLTLMEMMEGAQRGTIKALYCLGDDPAFNLPNSLMIKNALKNLELLIVQDIFLTETARHAHVVLPAHTWSEENGTFTNLEGRIQKVQKAIPGYGRDNWKIIADMSNTMGYKMDYRKPEDIIKEVAEISPLYKGLTYKSISSEGIKWPYLGEVPDTGEDKIPMPECCRRPKFDGPISIKRDYLLFHSGSVSQMSSSLQKISSEPILKVSSAIMKEYGLVQGEKVIISSVIDSLEVRVEEDHFLPIKDMVMLSNNFPSASVYQLLGYSLDPVTKAPGYDGWTVTIKKKV